MAVLLLDITMQEKGDVFMGFNIHFGKLRLEFALGLIYVKVKISVVSNKKQR